MSKIKLISIEGVDCSGKSTLVKSLEKHYTGISRGIKIFRQPGSTPVGNALRELIMSTDMDETTRIMLFVASRMEFYSNEILPLLNDGNNDNEVIVITDRWFHSTIVYNVDGNQHNEDFYFDKMLQLEKKVDATIFLDVSPEEAQKRLSSRNEEQNRFDLGGIEVYQKRINTYIKIKEADKTMHRVDANQSVDDIFLASVKIIENIQYRQALSHEIRI